MINNTYRVKVTVCLFFIWVFVLGRLFFLGGGVASQLTILASQPGRDQTGLRSEKHQALTTGQPGNSCDCVYWTDLTLKRREMKIHWDNGKRNMCDVRKQGWRPTDRKSINNSHFWEIRNKHFIQKYRYRVWSNGGMIINKTGVLFCYVALSFTQCIHIISIYI